jgi:hypothetical protein
MQIRPRTRGFLAALTAAVAVLTLGASALPAQAGPDRLDPAALPRGADPQIPHLVGNELRDGDRSFRVKSARHHLDLYRTARGYVVVDNLRDRRRPFRITAYDNRGTSKVLARPDFVSGSAVSPRGTRVAWSDAKGDLGEPVVVKVVDPHTGVVQARRTFERAEVLTVTGSRVLLTRPGYRRVLKTWWWNYRRDTLRTISDQYAVRADVRHDKVVFAPRSTSPARCHRIAPLSRPSRTLWRSCGISPRSWSPNGDRALSTHIYFDYPGTDRWVNVNGRTGERGARINGRLDWDVAWEDNRHYLTMAQGDDGNAAVIRCAPSGSCERASRVWDLEVDLDAYYVAPPVVLAGN